MRASHNPVLRPRSSDPARRSSQSRRAPSEGRKPRGRGELLHPAPLRRRKMTAKMVTALSSSSAPDAPREGRRERQREDRLVVVDHCCDATRTTPRPLTRPAAGTATWRHVRLGEDRSPTVRAVSAEGRARPSGRPRSAARYHVRKPPGATRDCSRLSEVGRGVNAGSRGSSMHGDPSAIPG